MDKILIVDDDVSILRVLRIRLESANYAVSTAACIEEAQNRLLEEVFDIAIVDLRLGEECGIDLMKRLHRTDPQLPVIILTAYGTDKTAMRAMKEGAYCFLTKPFDNLELFAKVREGIEQSKRSNEVSQLWCTLQN